MRDLDSHLSPCCFPRAMLPLEPCRSEWPVLPPGWGHSDVQVWVAAEDHIWVHDPSTVRVCVDVPGLCCLQSLHRVSGLGCHLWPCWCPRVVLPLKPWKSGWPKLPPRAKVLTNPKLLLMVMSGSQGLSKDRQIVTPHSQRLTVLQWYGLFRSDVT